MHFKKREGKETTGQHLMREPSPQNTSNESHASTVERPIIWKKTASNSILVGYVEKTITKKRIVFPKLRLIQALRVTSLAGEASATTNLVEADWAF